MDRETIPPELVGVDTSSTWWRRLLSSPWLAGIILLGLIVTALMQHLHGADDLESRVFMQLAVLVLVGFTAHTTSGLLNKRLGLNEVVTWLLLGIAIGNIPIPGFLARAFIEQGHDAFGVRQALQYGSHIGVMILIFDAGLETHLSSLIKNAPRAGAAAAIGMAIAGTIVFVSVTRWLQPHMSLEGRLYTAAIVMPTSLGIPLLVLQRAGIIKSETAQFLIAVAALDDIFSLVTLTSLQGQSVEIKSMLWVLMKAVGFIAAAFVSGAALAPVVSLWLQRANDGEPMRLHMALFWAALFGFIAHALQLSPLMGMYAAGAFLTAAHFEPFEGESHGVESLLKPIKYVFVPVFLVSTGMQVILRDVVSNPWILALTVISLTVALPSAKIASVLPAPEGCDKPTLATALISRGEIALVIAGMAPVAYRGQLVAYAVLMVVATAIAVAMGVEPLIRRARRRGSKAFPLSAPSPSSDQVAAE